MRTSAREGERWPRVRRDRRGRNDHRHAQRKTYYVCCTTCKQAFEDDPEGILAEYFASEEGGEVAAQARRTTLAQAARLPRRGLRRRLIVAAVIASRAAPRGRVGYPASCRHIHCRPRRLPAWRTGRHADRPWNGALLVAAASIYEVMIAGSQGDFADGPFDADVDIVPPLRCRERAPADRDRRL